MNVAENFFRKCKINGLATETITGYQYSLSTFQKFYQGNMDRLAQDDIDGYYEYLQDNYSNLTTINNKLRDLRVFLRWAGKDFKISLIKHNETEIMPLESHQLREIYDACMSRDEKNYSHFRDYIIMRLLEETGMRISEVLRLQARDIDLKNLTVQISTTKNKKARATYFTRDLSREIANFLGVRQSFLSTKQLAATSLFVNKYGQPLSYRTISQNITNYGDMAGITGVRVSAHTFRHTFAKNFLINGGDIFTLKDILGHSTFDMVYRYARLWDKQRNEKYQAVMGNYSRSKNKSKK